jgi:hypothetical protein
VKVRGPDLPEVAELVSELRDRRDEALAILRETESQPPSLEEVKSMLPRGVQLVCYHPRPVPFAVAPISIVTNAGKFYRAYLTDLARSLERQGRGYPLLTDVLAKLSAGGLELKIT